MVIKVRCHKHIFHSNFIHIRGNSKKTDPVIWLVLTKHGCWGKMEQWVSANTDQLMRTTCYYWVFPRFCQYVGWGGMENMELLLK